MKQSLELFLKYTYFNQGNKFAENYSVFNHPLYRRHYFYHSVIFDIVRVNTEDNIKTTLDVGI